MQQPRAAASPFGPERRIRRKADFQRVFDTGVRVHGRFFTMLAAPNDAGAARLGIVASRKLGNAVHRNRAKRLIREIFRRSVPSGGGLAADLVVIPRREVADASYAMLENDFRTVLRRSAGRLPRRD